MKIDGMELTLVDLSPTINSKSNFPRITLGKNKIAFNTCFCKVLKYPRYIELYVNVHEKTFAFRGINEPSENCRNFYKKRDGNKKAVKSGVLLTGKEFIKLMRNIIRTETASVHGEVKGEFIVFNLENRS